MTSAFTCELKAIPHSAPLRVLDSYYLCLDTVRKQLQSPSNCHSTLSKHRHNFLHRHVRIPNQCPHIAPLEELIILRSDITTCSVRRGLSSPFPAAQNASLNICRIVFESSYFQHHQYLLSYHPVTHQPYNSKDMIFSYSSEQAHISLPK